jgi:DNA-binding XRE family transcriptional regulator
MNRDQSGRHVTLRVMTEIYDPADLPRTHDPVALVRVRRLASSGVAKKRREDAGLSIADIAEAIGVSATTVFRWENSLRRPTGEAALRYGRLLDELREVMA